MFSLQIRLIQAQLITLVETSLEDKFGSYISCLCKAWSAFFSLVQGLVCMFHMEQGMDNVSGHMALDPSLLCITRTSLEFLLQATFPLHLMLHFITLRSAIHPINEAFLLLYLVTFEW